MGKAKADQFLENLKFRMNPFGTNFDPEEVAQRLASGEDEGPSSCLTENEPVE